VLVGAGYIRVFRMRGKYGSEGDYVMTRRYAARSTTAAPTTPPMPGTPSTGW
jgi:hypothetical protein